MPEISRFLGIKIFMYFNEHNPPHFHVEYNEYKASINIKTFGVREGRLPSKVLGLVVEWAEDHQNELLKKVYKLQTLLTPIEGLNLETLPLATESLAILLEFVIAHNFKVIQKIGLPKIIENKKYL